jgi:hypothetical protein
VNSKPTFCSCITNTEKARDSLKFATQNQERKYLILIQKLILQSQTPRIFKELILLSALANILPNLSEIKQLAILAAQGESV